MKFLILAATIMMSLQSAADDSMLSQILRLYNAGTLPTQNQASGWFAGRCYSQEAPDRPIASLLAGVIDQMNGPIGQSFKLVIQLYETKSPDYFDNLSNQDRQDMESFVESGKSTVSEARVFDQSLSSIYRSENARYQLRQNGNFLTVKVVRFRDSGKNPANAVL
jgi:hypothetical protein